MKFVSRFGYSAVDVRKLIFQPCGRKQAKMAKKNRIKVAPRTDESVALSKEGAIVGKLARTKGKLRSDLHYLHDVGLNTYYPILERSKADAQCSIGDNNPYSRPTNVLKRAVYVLGCQLIELEKQDILMRYLQQHAKTQEESLVSVAAPDVRKNPFHWCYLLLLGKNRLEKDETRVVTRDQISKSSRQLVYAHKNNVPPEYLIGFILQIGAKNILRYHKHEDWFSWKTTKPVDRKKVKSK